MQGVYRVAEVRAAEEIVLARTADRELMLRAATGLARTSAEMLSLHRGNVYGARVVVLCGTGNNGGDALFAGAQLARRGAEVLVLPTGSHAHEAALQAVRREGGRILATTESAGAIASADLILDGIVGIGGSGSLHGAAAEMAELATMSDAVVVAVDIPSGVDADTGVADDTAVWADVTVTFGLMKPGLLLSPGSMRAGMLELVDIGLTGDAGAPSIACLEAADLAGIVPQPGPTDHKYSQGVTGIAAGSRQYPGAAVLAVSGALHTKAGLVRYVGEVADHVVGAWPSAIVSTGPIGGAGRVQAWGVGPGLGVGDDARRVVAEVLDTDLPVVMDADALTILAGHPAMLSGRTAPTVVTPHLGEFARLAPDLDLPADPVAAVQQLASRLSCTVLAKGATTVIADADGQVRLNLTGTPWLATGGTGDVLTGAIAALLSSGVAALDAAAAGAFLHGIAGRLASGDAPTTSASVAEALPDAIRAAMGA